MVINLIEVDEIKFLSDIFVVNIGNQLEFTFVDSHKWKKIYVYCDWRGNIFKVLNKSTWVCTSASSNCIVSYFKNFYTIWRVFPKYYTMYII
jgi:hypothetical protein